MTPEQLRKICGLPEPSSAPELLAELTRLTERFKSGESTLSDAVAVMSAMPALLDFVRMATDTQRVQQETIAHLQQECIRMRAVVETAVNGWEPHATGSSGTASTAIR